jgi:hypothetical protein
LAEIKAEEARAALWELEAQKDEFDDVDWWEWIVGGVFAAVILAIVAVCAVLFGAQR